LGTAGPCTPLHVDSGYKSYGLDTQSLLGLYRPTLARPAIVSSDFSRPGMLGVAAVFRRAIQHQATDFRDVLLAQLAVTNEKAHIDCAVEDVEQQIEIQVAGELAAFHSSSQCLVGFLPPGQKKAL